MTVRHDAIDLLRQHFPALEFREVRIVEDGWDSLVVEIDEQWVFRFPRRPEVEGWVEREIRLLPILAETLPVAVPRFELVARNGVVCVGYRRITGSPASSGISELAGRDVGSFLTALHRSPLEPARAIGVPFFDPAAWREHFASLGDDFRRRVYPLLRSGECQQAETVFARIHELDFEPALIHGDLGPAHILCQDGRLNGVIDWSDARIGDPALDLAWCLNGVAAEVAEAVAQTYVVDAGLRERALFYHRLGPWYEVAHGLETEQSRLVTRALEGVRSRLPTAP